MRLINLKLLKTLIITSSLFVFSCQTPNTVSSDFGVDLTSIETGSLKNGQFLKREDKTFVGEEKINLKFTVKGLIIKSGKIKVNIDIFLKKDKEVVGVESDILGNEGMIKDVGGVNSDYQSNIGVSDINLNIIPPKDVKGEISANITVKDLNSSSKISTFETKFMIK